MRSQRQQQMLHRHQFFVIVLGLVGIGVLVENLRHTMVKELTSFENTINTAIPPFYVEEQINDYVIENLDTQNQQDTKFTKDMKNISFILLRAIGNPMPPRHDSEQAYQNLAFTLEHEQSFPNVDKYWVLNRIVDENLLSRLVELLEKYEMKYTIIPFSLSDYEKLNYNFTLYQPIPDAVHQKDYIFDKDKFMIRFVNEAITNEKNHYVTNQNAARNMMINIGKQSGADWVLPWDGNCFLHAKAYKQMCRQLLSLPEGTKYAITPMNRASDNAEVLEADYKPNPIEEPQVILHSTAEGRFNALMRYGRRNKVEFIQRMKAKGFWDEGVPFLPWEKSVMGVLYKPIPDLIAPAKKVSFTTRLTSGQQHLENKVNVQKRGKSRDIALNILLGDMDTRVVIELHNYQPGQLIYYDEDALARDRDLYKKGNNTVKSLVDQLLADAKNSLTSGPWSVVQKPASTSNITGSPNNYYSRAPFYWSDGDKWVHRSGKHYPGTILHDSESHKYDRTRLHDMQYNTTILALAYFMTGEDVYAQVAARNIRTWFIDNSTAMSPYLDYASVWNGTGHPAGVMEMKDLYFMLDAVRLVERGGFLSEEEQRDLRNWFELYLNWMESSTLGRLEYSLSNNVHGVFYDAQAIAIAAYLNNTAKMIYYVERAVPRMKAYTEHFFSSSSSWRTSYQHLFALQGWSTLARLTEPIHRFLWTWHIINEKSALCRMASTEVDDNLKWLPLFYDELHFCEKHKVVANEVTDSGLANAYKIGYNQSGFAPFWNLGLKSMQS